MVEGNFYERKGLGLKLYSGIDQFSPLKLRIQHNRCNKETNNITKCICFAMCISVCVCVSICVCDAYVYVLGMHISVCVCVTVCMCVLHMHWDVHMCVCVCDFTLCDFRIRQGKLSFIPPPFSVSKSFIFTWSKT